MSIEVLNSLGITKQDVMENVVQAIKEDLSGEIQRSVNAQLKELVLQLARETIEAHLRVGVEDLLAKPRQPLDEWGDPKGQPVSLRDMVKEKAIKFLSEKVNDRGEANQYGHGDKTRLQYYIKEVVEKAMSYELKKELDQAVATAKVQLKNQVAQHIVSTLLK